jgi:sec-independent protein translocase protein TatB
MFDVGFLELVLIAIIGLLVLGPERLPVAARTIGRWVGKAKRMTSQFSQEINRQIEVEELKKELQKQGESLNINEDAHMIHNTVKDALKDAEEFEPLPRTEPDKPFNTPKEDKSANEANSNKTLEP